MKNKNIKNNKKKADKTIKMKEISNQNIGELWYVITKQNKLTLLFFHQVQVEYFLHSYFAPSSIIH
jgi:restriction endonuclease